MKRRWLVCSVVVLSLVLALPASMQTPTHSVLTNGGFEVDTSGWTVGTGTLARTTTTVRSGSGAAEATLEDMGSAFLAVHGQCVNLSPYLATWPEDGGVKYLTVNGYLYSDGTTTVTLDRTFYSDTDCTGSNFGGVVFTLATTNASWELHTLTDPIPSGANSIWIAFRGGSLSPGVFYADDLAVFSSTTTAVRSQGMAARNSLWAVGLVGVAAVGVVLGRRKKS